MALPPLFAVSGATGVGKTTATARLRELVPDVLRLDGDLLWSNEFFDRPGAIDHFYATWLSIAAAIAENGVSLVFCGVVMPSNWEPLPARERVGEIHYLAIVCEPDVHEERLRGRGLGSEDHQFPNFLDHNRWLRDNASTTEPPMGVIDSTHQTPDETTDAVAAWIRSKLGDSVSA